MSNMEQIIIDGFDFTNLDAMKYYSFTAAFKGDKKAKARELCLSGSYLGSRKMDGAWAMIIRDNSGNFHLRSRTESVNGGYADKAEWIPHICEELGVIPNGTVLLGEIYFPNNEGSRKITSVLNCLKDKCLERQKKNGWLHFYIFDTIAWNGKSLINTAFESRIKQINQIKSTEHIEIAQYVEGKELWDLFGDVIALGGEGIVITRKDCKYLPGKRTAWMTLKMKKELTDTIDAFLDGAYKPAAKGYTGKEIETWPYWMNRKTNEKVCECKYREYSYGELWEPITKAYYNDWASSVSFSVMRDGVPVRIGWISGITDQLKEEIVHAPEKWIHKVASLTAMEVMNINGEYTLRHGKIEKWRNGDKSYTDCSFDQIAK